MYIDSKLLQYLLLVKWSRKLSMEICVDFWLSHYIYVVIIKNE